jgi:hypothetical protein
MQTVTTIGLDIAKSVFQVHGVEAHGNVLVRRQLKRRQVVAFLEKLPPCLVGLEACASSHHWSRELQALGHAVRLTRGWQPSPNYMNDRSDTNNMGNGAGAADTLPMKASAAPLRTSARTTVFLVSMAVSVVSGRVIPTATDNAALGRIRLLTVHHAACFFDQRGKWFLAWPPPASNVTAQTSLPTFAPHTRGRERH